MKASEFPNKCISSPTFENIFQVSPLGTGLLMCARVLGHLCLFCWNGGEGCQHSPKITSLIVADVMRKRVRYLKKKF